MDMMKLLSFSAWWYVILWSPNAFSQDLSRREVVKLADRTGLEHQEEWAKLADQRNLKRDLRQDRADWTRIFPIVRDQHFAISGSRRYEGFIEKDYRYDVDANAAKNELTVTVRMHFYPSHGYTKKSQRLADANDPDRQYYPLTPEVLKHMDEELVKAEQVWNRQAPAGVKFHFVRMTDAKDAHYSIKLVSGFRVLYDQVMMAEQSYDVLAHEIGHMMGLDDEYDMVGSGILPVHTWINDLKKAFHRPVQTFEQVNVKDMKCNLNSLMCLKEQLYPYHFNHILGRIPTQP